VGHHFVQLNVSYKAAITESVTLGDQLVLEHWFIFFGKVVSKVFAPE
jgi:hypothetical protein